MRGTFLFFPSFSFRNSFCAHGCAGLRLLVKWVKKPDQVDLVSASAIVVCVSDFSRVSVPSSDALAEARQDLAKVPIEKGDPCHGEAPARVVDASRPDSAQGGTQVLLLQDERQQRDGLVRGVPRVVPFPVCWAFRRGGARG